ncbi:MAG: MATE family efflux transporter [FCB group bacterium]|nr:MATE family efflux transporter [FCB group bacterium]
MADSGTNITQKFRSEHTRPVSRDLKRKIVGTVSLNRAILKLSLPAMGGWYLEFFYNIIDTFWVGKLGPSALAAVGVSTFILWSVFTLTDILTAGTSAIVARRIGEEKFETATNFAGSVIGSVFIAGAVVSILGLLNIDNLFAFVDPSPEAVEYGKSYLTIVLSGAIFVFISVWCQSLFQTNGDAKTPMKIFAVSLGINAILTPMLVFGIAFFPRMEVAGAAFGTFFSMLINSVVSLIILVRRGLLPRTLARYRPSLKNTLQVMKIGTPSSLTGFTFCIVLVGISQIAAKYGDEVLAAITVGVRLEDFAWVACMGLYVSAITLVGQYLGAGDQKNAVRAGWRSMWIGFAICAVFAVIYFFAGKWLIYPFNNDPLVLEYGQLFLKIDSISLAFTAMGVILSGAMVGAGAALIPMMVALPLLIVRIPLAIFLSENMDMGVKGIFLAMAGTMIVRGLMMSFVYSRKGWLKTKV